MATPHERVREIVAADLRPVRPLWSPIHRLLMLSPLALVLAVMAGLRYGPRSDFSVLGPLVSWGLSVGEWSLGLLVVGSALWEAVPGNPLSDRKLSLLWLGATATVAAITMTTYATHPSSVPVTRTWRVWYLCLIGLLEFGAPLLLLATVLIARAYATRPVLAGALCGIGVGLITDAGWRLTCQYTTPSHVFSAHALAVVLLVITGATVMSALDLLRRRASAQA